MYSGHKIDMIMVLLEEKERGEVVVEVLGKDSHVLLGYLFSLLRILKQCLVKEQDSGRRKELEEVPLTLLWAGSYVSYASLPKDKAAQAGYIKN